MRIIKFHHTTTARPPLRLEPGSPFESSDIRVSPFDPAISATGLEQTPGYYFDYTIEAVHKQDYL